MSSSIEITNPYITIAGQTAPGGGITLKSANSGSSDHLQVRAHDVVIRYIRSRPGTKSTNGRALTVSRSGTPPHNVVVDHMSMSWSGDEMFITWYDTNTITLQWSIIAESLPPGHKGPNLGDGGSSGNLSLHHNLMAHHNQRYPLTRTGTGPIDLVNNIMYNLGSYGYIHLREQTKANLINNYIKGGPNGTISSAVKDDISSGGYYRSGNYIEPGWSVNSFASDGHRVSTRYNAPNITTSGAQQAYEDILNESGAAHGLDCNGNWFERREAVDLRIVQSVRDGTRGHGGSGFISDPSDVGGWPNLDPGTPCTDSDHDGMPNDWENLYSFNPNSSSDGNQDYDGDGYTNIEEYLNGTNPRSGEPPPSITITSTPTGDKPGDANGDGFVNIDDYPYWINNYFTTTPGGPQNGDFNESGFVDGLDYLIWLNNYSTSI
jgi:hypothetical protein